MFTKNFDTLPPPIYIFCQTFLSHYIFFARTSPFIFFAQTPSLPPYILYFPVPIPCTLLLKWNSLIYNVLFPYPCRSVKVSPCHRTAFFPSYAQAQGGSYCYQCISEQTKAADLIQESSFDLCLPLHREYYSASIKYGCIILAVFMKN